MLILFYAKNGLWEDLAQLRVYVLVACKTLNMRIKSLEEGLFAHENCYCREVIADEHLIYLPFGDFLIWQLLELIF